jgi:hypothetical protein
MKFFAITAAFAAVAAAHYSALPVEESCSSVVTVTVTRYVFHPVIETHDSLLTRTSQRPAPQHSFRPCHPRRHWPSSLPHELRTRVPSRWHRLPIQARHGRC